MVKKMFKNNEIDLTNIPYYKFVSSMNALGYAKDYVQKGRISFIDQEVRDDILVDSIQTLYDIHLTKKNLYEEHHNKFKMNTNLLLDNLKHHYGVYLFDTDVLSSIYNEDSADLSDALFVLVDFLNYISEQNHLKHKYTAAQLYNESKAKGKTLKKVSTK